MNNPAAGAAPHRRDEILRLIREETVFSQEELSERLRERGFAVTQPTLSRDLKDLSVVKTPSGYTRAETGSMEAHGDRRDEKLNRALREFVSSVETAGTLVVLKTPPSAAHPVAYALDEAGLDEAVGTIAGDDTIFVATKSAALAEKLAKRLLSPLRPVAVSPSPRRPRV